jgi:hypothetical protein
MRYNEDNYTDCPKEDVLDEVPIYLWSDWLQHASEEDKADLGFVKKLVTERGECLRFAPDALKADKKVVLEAVKAFSYAIVYAAEQLQSDREFIKRVLQSKAEAIRYVRDEFKDDRELALIAVNTYGGYIEDVSERLQNDRRVIDAALKHNLANIRYMPQTVRDNKEIVLRAMAEYGHMLEYVSERLRTDREVVLTAVSSAWSALGFALGGLQGDRDVVLAAVRHDGWALQFASEELKDDREIVAAAIENCGEAFHYASDRLKDDRELVLAAVRKSEYGYRNASGRLQRDKEVAAAAIRAFPELFESLPEEMQTSTAFLLFGLECRAERMPSSDDYSFFGDGTSEYYGAFEDAEDAFCALAAKIPIRELKNDPGLVGRICALALRADASYDDEEHENPDEKFHVRLPVRIKEYLAENGLEASAALEEAVASREPDPPPDEHRRDMMEPEEKLLNETADEFDRTVNRRIKEYGAESYREYLSPGGNYVRHCMTEFVKRLIGHWPGRFHDSELWRSEEYEVDLDRVYEEIRPRLSAKMKVERAAFEYYYSEYVGVAVNDHVYLKLVRDFPLKILELWVNKPDPEHERGFWVSPDRLDVFCEMAEYVLDNYARFEKTAESRAAALREKHGL